MGNILHMRNNVIAKSLWSHNKIMAILESYVGVKNSQGTTVKTIKNQQYIKISTYNTIYHYTGYLTIVEQFFFICPNLSLMNTIWKIFKLHFLWII